MALEIQIVVDSNDPHNLADWWAETLGWEVETPDENFIRRMVDEGYASSEDTIVHRGALVWRPGAGIHDPQGTGPRVLFQMVEEPKTVKNRLHLDVRAGTTNLEPQVTQLTARGAAFVHRGQQGPFHWVTMTDPQGNEFCVTAD